MGARRRHDGSPPGREQPRWLAGGRETRERRAPLACGWVLAPFYLQTRCGCSVGLTAPGTSARSPTDLSCCIISLHCSARLPRQPPSITSDHPPMLCGWCSRSLVSLSLDSSDSSESSLCPALSTGQLGPASAKSAAPSVANISNPILVFCDFLRTPACVLGLCSGTCQSISIARAQAYGDMRLRSTRIYLSRGIPYYEGLETSALVHASWILSTEE